MSNTNNTEHKSSRADKHDEYTPALHLPSASAKHTTPIRGVQAERRNTRKGQPGRVSLTLPPRKDEQTAAGTHPQVGQQDTKVSDSPGGSDCSASSHSRNALKRKIYDPLLGNHHIPTVEASDLMEQIVEEANFLRAIDSVSKDPDKAPGYDHRKVGDVCRILYKIKFLLDLAKQNGYTAEQIKARFNVSALEDLSKVQCSKAIDVLNGKAA